MFYDLAGQTSSAYSRGDAATAKQFAQEYLSAAPRFPCDWNYGNAVHNANAVLGLIALQDPQPMSTWLDRLAAREVPNFGMNARKMP